MTRRSWMTSLLGLIAVLLILAGLALWRSRVAAAGTPAVQARPVEIPLVEGALDRFAGAIRIPTVSQPSQPPDEIAMGRFHSYLQTSFPLVHAVLRHEVVGQSSLLYTWTGTEHSLAPVLLMGHMDVVPVDPSSLARWTHPPFSGEAADGYIWGRGSMDDKQAVMAILEAAESLLRQNFHPRRTILFAFGDDEENDGHGAEALVNLLASRNLHPIFVMDEGGQIARGTIPGVSGDAALISIAEKGIVSVQLTVQSSGGHSSRPPAHTAVGVMSHAIVELEQHQMPARLTGVTADMLDALASRMPFRQRLMLRNRWLFDSVLARSLESTPNGNALLRTTTAATIFQSGVKDNVLPGEAKAIVNFRILPGDSVDSVLRHVRDKIHDPQVHVGIYGNLAAEPSPVSPIDTASYRVLETTVRQFFPGTIVVPNLLTARTDSARYYALTPNVYKFFPAIRDEADGERVHGLNERLSMRDYLRAVQFMAALLQAESAA